MTRETQPRPLDGKVAVVTGGSRGLGREMIRAFASAGADVVVASRKLDACEALAAEVSDAAGVRALALACHRMVEALRQAAGGRTARSGLIRGAGATGPRARGR